jgi:hypothetical protein
MVQQYKCENASVLHGDLNERLGKKHRRVKAENQSPYGTARPCDNCCLECKLIYSVKIVSVT